MASDPLDPHGRRPPAVVLVEAVSVVGFALAFAPLAARLASGLTGPLAWGGALVGALVGWIAADLASGTVHWFCDRFFEEDTPVVGRLLIYPFRDHHRDPRAMTRHGLLELMGNSCLVLIPLALLVGLRPQPVALDALVVSFSLALLLTNLFHCWAHSAEVPRLVGRLQAWGVILPVAVHEAHHTAGHLGGYCVTSGWANRWMDGWGVFARMERVLVSLGVPATREP
jgi:ubiquitin-conjugating enzyme E2 variant